MGEICRMSLGKQPTRSLGYELLRQCVSGHLEPPFGFFRSSHFGERAARAVEGTKLAYEQMTG